MGFGLGAIFHWAMLLLAWAGSRESEPIQLVIHIIDEFVSLEPTIGQGAQLGMIFYLVYSSRLFFFLRWGIRIYKEGRRRRGIKVFHLEKGKKKKKKR